LKHKLLVNNEAIHSYLASLTAASRVGCLRFELLQAASSVAMASGSLSDQLVSPAFTGLKDHHWQVCYFLYLNVLVAKSVYYCYYYYYFFPILNSPKNYAMQYKKYKNQAGMNLTPPPPSQNCHAVRWHIIIKMALL